jgi:hypothetical protein
MAFVRIYNSHSQFIHVHTTIAVDRVEQGFSAHQQSAKLGGYWIEK